MQHNEIKGFTDQSDRNKALVNKNKEIEERVLRIIDELRSVDDLDQRCIAIAQTQIQQGFMWLNRGIFQPERVVLDDPDPVGSMTQAEADKMAKAVADGKSK